MKWFYYSNVVHNIELIEMAETKTTKYLVTAIVCLVLVCIGLIIGLVVNTKNSNEALIDTGR